MKTNRKYAALFDLDGVVLDTETQYTHFWDEQGLKYLERENFCALIKGQTLTQILSGNFTGELEKEHPVIIEALNRFEQEMKYPFIAGAREFIVDLRNNGVKTAVVTSSNMDKMRNVYRTYPDFESLFDVVLTGEMFSRSKPHPECFLKAMRALGTTPEDSIVFEDSFHGLTAGRCSGAFVVGLATTNPESAIINKADLVISDFTHMNFNKFTSLLM
jgi:HAD superfamily hydrolase (TIGR01509 family)